MRASRYNDPHDTAIEMNEAETDTFSGVNTASSSDIPATKPMILKAYYRSELGKPFFILMCIYLVIALIAIIWNMTHWSSVISANSLLTQATNEAFEDYDLGTHVVWIGVLGIVLVIAAFIGMVFSQSVFFLLLGLYIELSAIFTIWIALIYEPNAFLLYLIVILVVSSILSGPSFQAYKSTKAVRKRYHEITGSK
eukprot:CAMPEP_0197046092 /NCGR_PEP_ID=MMETSP1384-20130603/21841_1 /TAXON_ID=29189 /ORGANISM="Ammonia sp." /LENGTH=195 /DNA_ID=CAMNT_0042477805 /DNA_START=74 /DNA_END=661 /DNA_ORIENTATION=+